jgi:hypothetical protein
VGEYESLSETDGENFTDSEKTMNGGHEAYNANGGLGGAGGAYGL